METKRKVTQNDVARRAGITRSMVSYVLNGSDRAVAKETREKILRAIDELGYRPNKFARALLLGKKEALAENQIGIVLCDAEMFLRPYYAEILAGIHSAAHEHGYHIRFIRFFHELSEPVLFNQLIHAEEVCGLLLVATDQCLRGERDFQIINRVRERVDNIVCVEWKMDGLSSVYFDRHEAARKAASYLFDKGYSGIAYIGEFDERTSGFKQSFIEHGIEDVSKLSITIARDMPSGYEAVKRLHEDSGLLPRAICAGSDEVAIGILQYLNERRLNIPSDVAVISIDNIEMAAYTSPPLTTVNVQKRAMGCRAVEMIVNRSAGQGDNAVIVSLPSAIVVRKSA